MDRRICFIVNPIAGQGRGMKAWALIEDYFAAKQIEITLFQTDAHGHALDLARQAIAQDFTDIVVVGGDGTVNQVVEGMAGASIALGLVPCGTGNDLGRALGLPGSLDKQLDIIATGKIKEIDIGIINDRIFVNSTGAGFDAAVAADVNRVRFRFGGFPAYLFFVLKELFTFARHEVTIKIDDKIITRRPWLVAVTNGKSYGAGMQICPEAINDDGLLDVCIVGDISRWLVPLYVPLIMMGRHRGLPKVEFYQTDRAVIETNGYAVQVDGEVLVMDRLEYSVKPKSLRVLVG